MFELLLFDAASTNRLRQGSAFLSHLRELKLKGAPRQDTNREYFRWWTGRHHRDVEEIGRKWFDHALAAHGKEIIHPEVNDRILEHEVLGDRIVLVSGSFHPALAPLAQYIGAHDILASSPEVVNGIYTGFIDTPMISEGKATAVTSHALEHGFDLGACHAYGDDTSDLPFMEITGNPVVVSHPRSVFAADSSLLGWPLIPIT